MVSIRHLLDLAVIVAVGRNVVGVWPTAMVLAGWCLWMGVRAWCRAETRSRWARPGVLVPEVVVPFRRRQPHGGHVPFARGLAAVTAAYLAECEREENAR
jgi:hypothetical protein